MTDSRDRLFWRVVANAATKPLNVLVLAVLVAAAVLVNGWIAAAAVPVYGLLMAATIRDPKEADRLAGGAERRSLEPGSRSLQGVTGDLRGQVIAALNEERGIVQELARTPAAPSGVREDVAGLCDEVLEAARRASDVDLYLATVDVGALRSRAAEYVELARHSEKAREAHDAIAEQLKVVDDLRGRRDGLAAEIDHVTASLGTIRARLVQARASASSGEPVTGDVTELRERMRVMAESLAEAYGQNAAGNTITKGT